MVIAVSRRSTSLPCFTSHPIFSETSAALRSLHSWRGSADPSSTSPLSCLAVLHHLLSSLYNFTLLPSSTAALKFQYGGSRRLADTFLRLTQAYNSFIPSSELLIHHCVEAQDAIRRNDRRKLVESEKSMKNTEKDLGKLTYQLITNPFRDLNQEEGTTVRLIKEAIAATTEASADVFSAVAAASAAVLTVNKSLSRKSCRVLIVKLSRLKGKGKKKRREKEEEERKRALERMEKLEECIRGVNKESQNVLRSLVKNRIALLNILSSLCI